MVGIFLLGLGVRGGLFCFVKMIVILVIVFNS